MIKPVSSVVTAEVAVVTSFLGVVAVDEFVARLDCKYFYQRHNTLIITNFSRDILEVFSSSQEADCTKTFRSI